MPATASHGSDALLDFSGLARLGELAAEPVVPVPLPADAYSLFEEQGVHPAEAVRVPRTKRWRRAAGDPQWRPLSPFAAAHPKATLIEA